MNETEKRRKKLLEQTRNLYQDDRMNPAVHPRYKAAYNRIYPEEMHSYKGTLGFRTMICILLLFAYVTMGTKNADFLEMDNMQIRESIMQNYMFELFKNS